MNTYALLIGGDQATAKTDLGQTGEVALLVTPIIGVPVVGSPLVIEEVAR